MDEYWLFRKDRLGRQGGGVALYMGEQEKCMELCLGMDDEPADSLWVRISGQTNMGEVVVGRMQTCISKPD